MITRQDIVAFSLGNTPPVPLEHDASRRNHRSRDANSELVQLLCENQNPCYLCLVAGSNPRLARRPATKRKESESFYFLSSQPIEKSRIGRIKPRISDQFCLDRLGSIRPPSRNRDLASARFHRMKSRSSARSVWRGASGRSTRSESPYIPVRSRQISEGLRS